MKTPRLSALLVLLTLLITAGCGGGSGGTALGPTKAVLKLSTAGVPPGTLIGGVKVTVMLPNGVTVAQQADNSAADGVAVASGAAAGAGALLEVNAAIAGQLTVGIISTNGFAAGEFVTIKADIGAGFSPKQSDFSATIDGQVSDTAGASIPGVSASLVATIE